MPTIRRASTAVAAAIVAVAGLVACGDDDADLTTEAAEPPLAEQFDVPFGLDQIAGVEPIGRPAVYDQESADSAGDPVVTRSVRAAYRVTGDDPPAVLREAFTGLALALDNASIRSPADETCSGCYTEPGLWLVASGSQDSGDDPRDRAELQLWATAAGPILLVDASRSDTNPRPPGISTIETVGAGSESPSPVGSTEGSAGDLLFTEQSDDIHLPAGTRTLVADLPTSCGTGGSTSVLAADDGDAAVQGLLDEARERNEWGEIEGPETTTTDGVEVTRASFTIYAGGWGFDVLAVRGADDPFTTMYVTSCAD